MEKEKKKLIEQVDNDDTKGYYITKWGASKNPPYNTTNFLLKKVDKFDDLLDELLKVFEGEEFKINNILEVTCYETDENGKEVEIEKVTYLVLILFENIFDNLEIKFFSYLIYYIRYNNIK